MHQKFAKEHSKKKKKNHSLLTSLDPKFHKQRTQKRTSKTKKRETETSQTNLQGNFGSSLRDIKIFQKQPSFDLDTYKYE